MIERLKTWLLMKLTCSVNPEMVVTYDARHNLVFVGGEQISHSEALSLKAEAKYLRKTRLWSLMQETLRDHAIQTITTKSMSWEDMKSGKLMLYNLGVQEKIVEAVDKYKVN